MLTSFHDVSPQKQVFAVAWLGALLTLAASVQSGSYQVGVAPPTVKVMIKGATQGWPFEGTITNRYDLSLARNEHEAMQVVIRAITALSNARVTVSAPQEIHGAGPLNGEANAWLVGHVDVWDSTGYPVNYPEYMAGYRGWYPDPLLTFTNACNINAGDRVAFWIDVAALRAAAAGDYVATITVTADNSVTNTVQLNIHVWDFELPVKASLPTAFSLGKTTVGGGGATYVYGSDYDAKGMDQKFYDLALNRRMGIAHLYGGEVESFDNITDWAARGESAMNLKYLNKKLDLPKVTDPVLRTLYLNVTNAGLLGMSYIYGFDEVDSGHFSDLKTMFDQVHTNYPGLRTMTSAKDPSFGTDSNLRTAVDIWVPLTFEKEGGCNYDQTTANQLRTEGKDMWWYICMGPSKRPYINFFVEYPAIEPRLLMGLMAYKLQTGGFLYYQIANWPHDFHQPGGWITNGPYTSWDPRTVWNETKQIGYNGDGSLFCAGPDGPIPTIRSENIRDGLEDYEYLKLLADLVKTLQARGSLTAEERAWTNSAQQLLLVPSNLVGSLTSYTENPADLESYREQVAAAILTGKVLTAPPRPQLTVAPASTGNMCLLWPTNLAGFNLEAITNLVTTNWSNILPAPVVIGTNNVVTNALDTPRKFYRLRKP